MHENPLHENPFCLCSGVMPTCLRLYLPEEARETLCSPRFPVSPLLGVNLLLCRHGDRQVGGVCLPPARGVLQQCTQEKVEMGEGGEGRKMDGGSGEGDEMERRKERRERMED